MLQSARLLHGVTRRLDWAGIEVRNSAPMEQPAHVLVVDDDPEIRGLLGDYLERNGFRVSRATDGREMQRILASSRPDLVVLDVMLPGEDGYSLIRKLRAMDTPGIASIPAAALTGFARNEDRQQALQAGFQLHLAKPIDAQTLISAVATLGGRA